MIAAIVEPIKIPILACVSYSKCAWPNANDEIKIDMVKPIPQRIDTAKICVKVTPAGNLAAPNLTERKLKMKIPSGLPTNRPRATPRGSADARSAICTPCKDTPAFAKANNGKIKKAT